MSDQPEGDKQPGDPASAGHKTHKSHDVKQDAMTAGGRIKENHQQQQDNTSRTYAEDIKQRTLILKMDV